MANLLHVFEFLNQAPGETPTGVCAVFGGERFLKKMAVDRLVQNASAGDPDFSPMQFESDSTVWADVRDELSTRSLFGGEGPKIVIVDDADPFVSQNRDRLEQFAKQPGSIGLLILIVDSWAANTKLYKIVNQSGLPIRCDPPKPTPRSKSIDLTATSNWLIARAKATYEFELPESGARTLIEMTDCDFGRMDQELQKMALYADAKGKIQLKTIKQSIGGWRTQTMWEAIDAALDGNARAALDSLDLLFRGEEHPLALFGQLSWSLRRYGVATEVVFRQMRQGKKPDMTTACHEAGFTKWDNGLVDAQRRLRQLGSERAKQILDWLIEADLQLKLTHSQADRGRLVIEKLFVKMADELAPAKTA